MRIFNNKKLIRRVVAIAMVVCLVPSVTHAFSFEDLGKKITSIFGVVRNVLSEGSAASVANTVSALQTSQAILSDLSATSTASSTSPVLYATTTVIRETLVREIEKPIYVSPITQVFNTVDAMAMQQFRNELTALRAHQTRQNDSDRRSISQAITANVSNISGATISNSTIASPSVTGASFSGDTSFSDDVTVTGFLGIGTTSPVSALAVVGTTTVSGRLELTNGSFITASSSPVFRVIPSQDVTLIGRTGLGSITSNMYGLTLVGDNIAPYLDSGNGYSVLIGDNIFSNNTSQTYAPNSAVFIGSYAANNLESGSGNYSVAIGYEAMAGTGSGYNYNSTAIGYQALARLTSGKSNVAVGNDSGEYISSGGYNVVIGSSAGDDINTGDSNVVIGSSAGVNLTSGSNNILIGAGTRFSSNRSNGMNIGNVLYSDYVDEGASAASGSIGIGIASPLYRLHVSTTTTTNVARFEGSGGTQCTVVAGTGFSCTSDENLKTNITELPKSSLGKLLTLRSVHFNWKSNPDSDQQVGFLAQDVERVFPELVRTDASGIKSVLYAQVIPYIVKGMQELQSQIDFLKGHMTYTATSTIEVDKVISNNVTTKSLSAGGIEMKDEATGDTYCFTIRNGDWFKRMGQCGSANVVSNTVATPEIVVIPDTSTTTPVAIDVGTTTLVELVKPEVSSETPATTTEEVIPAPVTTIEEVTPTPEPVSTVEEVATSSETVL